MSHRILLRLNLRRIEWAWVGGVCCCMCIFFYSSNPCVHSCLQEHHILDDFVLRREQQMRLKQAKRPKERKAGKGGGGKKGRKGKRAKAKGASRRRLELLSVSPKKRATKKAEKAAVKAAAKPKPKQQAKAKGKAKAGPKAKCTAAKTKPAPKNKAKAKATRSSAASAGNEPGRASRPTKRQRSGPAPHIAEQEDTKQQLMDYALWFPLETPLDELKLLVRDSQQPLWWCKLNIYWTKHTCGITLPARNGTQRKDFGHFNFTTMEVAVPDRYKLLVSIRCAELTVPCSNNMAISCSTNSVRYMPCMCVCVYDGE